MSSKRMRLEIWASLQSRIQAEIDRTGLSLTEVVNIALADYFGLVSNGKHTQLPQIRQSIKDDANDSDDEEDYI